MDKATASREILWNVGSLPNSVAMYSFFAVSLLICGWGIWRRLQLWAAGTPADGRGGSWGRRFGFLWEGVLKQRGTNRQSKPAVFHTLILWGFLVLLFTTTMVLIDHDLGIDIYHGRFYLAVTILSDVFGLLLLVGVTLAIHRRYIEQPDKLHTTRSDALMLVLLGLMCLQGFILEGIRIQATNDPWAPYSPVGWAFGAFFWSFSDTALRAVHFAVWWF
ncbi:MAG: respiratory nitrate reductase subunit gamma, partial [Bdellovibrionales bacterium]|nr:respiratory nitrate reductase subunit gamma [Bdellovibrionales bacterium]